MPKFLIKHGCCYIPPVDNDSSTTCQVYSNPDFDCRVSDALCVGKSSPEFASHRKQISWGYIDEVVKPHGSRISPESLEGNSCRKTQENSDNEEENLSLFTIYGNKLHRDAEFYSLQLLFEEFLPKIIREAINYQISDVSIYRPTTTTRRISSSKDISSSEKFLDCISTCLWKCSSWCQKIE